MVKLIALLVSLRSTLFLFCIKSRNDKIKMQFALSCLVLMIITGCSHNQYTHQTNTQTSNSSSESKVKEKKSFFTEQEKTKNTSEHEDDTKQETPENKVKQAVFQAFGITPKQGAQKFSNLSFDTNENIEIKFKVDEDMNNHLTALKIKQNIANILFAIQNSKVNFKDVNVITNKPYEDQSGVMNEKELVNITFSNETIKKFDFESFNFENIYSIADTVNYIEPSLSGND